MQFVDSNDTALDFVTLHCKILYAGKTAVSKMRLNESKKQKS
jgi:hypothetical protein